MSQRYDWNQYKWIERAQKTMTYRNDSKSPKIRMIFVLYIF